MTGAASLRASERLMATGLQASSCAYCSMEVPDLEAAARALLEQDHRALVDRAARHVALDVDQARDEVQCEPAVPEERGFAGAAAALEELHEESAEFGGRLT
jgi:hypothetical protein